MVMIMWHIWKSRNAWYFNNELTDPSNLVTKTLFEHNKFLELTFVHSPNENSKVNYQILLKVHEYEICLLVDAELQVKSNKTSIGLVFMNSKGVLLHAHGSSI